MDNKAGKLVIGTEIDTDQFDKDLEELIEIAEDKGQDGGEDFGKSFDKGISDIKDDVKEGLDELSDVAKNTGENSGINFSESFGKGITNIKSKIDGIITTALQKATGMGNGLVKTLRIVSTLITGMGASLGIVGIILSSVAVIGSILVGAFKQAVSENQQMIVNLQYIVWAIQQALQPAIDFVAKMIVNIINLLIKALQLVAELIRRLTGKNIFENASAEKFMQSMENAEEKTKGVANNLKEARKQLAGFDEMNVLSDTGNVTGGLAGDVDNVFAPTVDFSQPTNEMGTFVDNWKIWGEEMEFWLNNVPFNVWTEAFGNWDLAMYGVVKTFNGMHKVIDGGLMSIGGLLEMVHGIATQNLEEIKTGFTDFIKGTIMQFEGWKEVFNGIIMIVVGVVLGAIRTIGTVIQNSINEIIYFYNWLGLQIKAVWDNIKIWIGQKLTEISNEMQNKFGSVGYVLGEIISGYIKAVVNTTLSYLETKINSFLKSINSAITVLNIIPGVQISKMNMVSFPRLAKGGIINQPGRGVMVGSAIAGERGQEGVLPLTDSQQMELLGEAIGRYITINANIINSMNGRIISRELKKIQNEDDFAFNR